MYEEEIECVFGVITSRGPPEEEAFNVAVDLFVTDRSVHFLCRDIEAWARCMYPYTITLSFAWVAMIGAR